MSPLLVVVLVIVVVAVVGVVVVVAALILVPPTLHTPYPVHRDPKRMSLLPAHTRHRVAVYVRANPRTAPLIHFNKFSTDFSGIRPACEQFFPGVT